MFVLFCFVIIQLIALLHRWNRLSFEKKVKSTCNEKKLYFVRVYFVMSLLLFSHNFFFCKIYHWIVCVVECKLKIKWITTERHIKKNYTNKFRFIVINWYLLLKWPVLNVWIKPISFTFWWYGLCNANKRKRRNNKHYSAIEQVNNFRRALCACVRKLMD